MQNRVNDTAHKRVVVRPHRHCTPGGAGVTVAVVLVLAVMAMLVKC